MAATYATRRGGSARGPGGRRASATLMRHTHDDHASSLLTRRVREGCTLGGSPGILGVQHSKALCDWAY